MSGACQGLNSAPAILGGVVKMNIGYYIILLSLIGLIVYFGWPDHRKQVQNDFNYQLIQERLTQLTLQVEALSSQLKTFETEPGNQTKPLSTQSLIKYQQIQADRKRGDTIRKLAERYNLLPGEVELIVGLMDGEEGAV